MASKEEVCQAAEKLVETLDTDASVFRMPVHVVIAIINLQRAVKAQRGLEEGLADRLAHECDKLTSERDKLRSLVEETQAELRQAKRERNLLMATDQDVWIWSDTDPNELVSLADSAVVKITAGQLRNLLAQEHLP